MDEPPEKLDEIRERLALEPFNAELHQALGNALHKVDPDAARQSYEQAVILDPADPWSHLYLGNLSYWKSDYQAALEEFELAHRLDPSLAMPLVCMADSYCYVGEIGLADEHYRKAVEVEPECRIAQRNLKRWKQMRRHMHGQQRPTDD